MIRCRHTSPVLRSLPRRLALSFFVTLATVAGAVGQAPNAVTPSAVAAGSGSNEADLPLIDLTEALVAEALPRHYADERDWNRQKHFTTGLRVERDGLRIETRRRKELVNHGTWKRYFVTVPDGRKASLDIAEAKLHEAGRVTLRLVAEAPVAGRAEVQEWQRGVRLVGISADCDATIRLTLDAEAVLKTEAGVIVPAVAIEPKVTSARVELVDFRLRRIGDLRGPLAKELGEAAEPTLRRVVAEQNEKIAAKLNKSLAKRNDKMRISADEFLREQWDNVKAQIAK